MATINKKFTVKNGLKSEQGEVDFYGANTVSVYDSNDNASFQVDGSTGQVTIGANTSTNFTLPTERGQDGYFLRIDANTGAAAWEEFVVSASIASIVEDTSPQLGGDLDVNDKLILNATGPVKLRAGAADYVTIVNSSGDDKIRFSDQGGVQALGTFHDFGDSSSGRGQVSIKGSTSGFFTGSGSLRIHDNDSSAHVELTVPTAVSANVTFTLPGADGSAGQVMQTDGSGNLSFAAISTDLVNDTTPQLGGELDLNSFAIRDNVDGHIHLKTWSGVGQYIQLGSDSDMSSNSYFGSSNTNTIIIGVGGTVHQDFGGGAFGMGSSSWSGAVVIGDNNDYSGNAQKGTFIYGTTGTGDGGLQLNKIKWPNADGSASQFLQTDGAGNLSFATVNTDLVNDTTPQLGGDLDVNDNLILNATGPVKLRAGSADYVTIVNSAGADKIRFSDLGGVQAFGTFHQFGEADVAAGIVNIMGSTNGFTTGSGAIRIHDEDSSQHVQLTVPATVSANVTFTLPGADGSASQFLQTDGSGNLSFATVNTDLVNDTTPQLGGDLDLNSNDITGTGNINVTGTVTTSGNATFGGSSLIIGDATNAGATATISGPGTITLDPYEAGANGTVVIAGDLTVQGTTTTVNSTTVEITDLNLTLGADAANAAEANGGGITLGGANATFTYDSANDRWTANKDIAADVVGNVTGNVTGNADTATALATSRTIELTGDVTGSASFDGSANAAISVTISANSVALGTDTTGNYVESVSGTGGIVVTNGSGEGSTPAISVDEEITLGTSTTTLKGTLEASISAATDYAVSTNTNTIGSKLVFAAVDASNTNSRHVTEVIALSDGTDTHITQYGEVYTGSELFTITGSATTPGDLQITPAAGKTVRLKVIEQAL